jgi:hypothetical protein
MIVQWHTLLSACKSALTDVREMRHKRTTKGRRFHEHDTTVLERTTLLLLIGMLQIMENLSNQAMMTTPALKNV